MSTVNDAGRGYAVTRSATPDAYTIHKDCYMCGQTYRLKVPQGLWDYEHGAFVQTSFPDLNADERELLISGTCGDCWAKMFPPEEES